MSKTLVLGTYSEVDEKALKCAFVPQMIKSADDLASMSPLKRDMIEVMAFKGYTALSAAHMDLLPNLKLIANYGVGYDAIDIPAAKARGIAVTNTPDVLSDDVADLAVAMLLMQLRQMEHASAWARKGLWRIQGDFPLARKSSGGKAGILGLGRIGREIAHRLSAFKMDIHYHARQAKETPGWTFHSDPIEMAKEVDYLLVALVGGRETENFVSREMIHALGPRGVIINISRGSTIDEPALIEALETGIIAGAGLDVFRNEPHIDPRFYDLPNVVIQPHHASATHETRGAMGQLQRDNINAYWNGEPLVTQVA